MDTLHKEANALSSYLVETRRYLHQHPEVGMDLPNTKRFVMEALAEMGLSPVECGAMGVTALIEGYEPGAVFLLRADMDALPMQEQTGLPFASQNAYMHACGHDCHTAMLLGAARILLANKAKFRGRVKLTFQPGEEIMAGAKDMVAAGLLASPRVDAAMMMHIVSGSDAATGTVSVPGAGISYAFVDWFRVEIQGQGGHGAEPERAINPLSILTSVASHINEIRNLKLASHEFAAISIGEMHGGTVANVIPDTAYLTGTIRTSAAETSERIKTYLAESIPQLAMAKGGQADVLFTISAPGVQSDRTVRDSIVRSTQRLLGEAHVFDLGQDPTGMRSMVSGSEDFAYIAEKVPAGLVWLYAGTPEQGYCYGAHHPKVDFDEAALPVGAAVYAACAMDWLNAQAEP